MKRISKAALIVATCLSLPEAPANACHCLDKLFGCRSCASPVPVATVAPTFQTVSYVPQTCFRTVMVNQPVVAYQPVQSCDPCTGCPTTVMRPVTSCCMRPQLVPYTTYRPVVTTARCQPVCASGCGMAPATTVGYAPMPVTTTVAPAAVVAPAAPCCSPSASYSPGTPGTTIRSLTPSTTYATTPASAPTYSVQPQTTAPTLTAPPPQTTPQNRTFQEQSPSTTEPESRLLMPKIEPSRTNGTPRLLDPELQDRMTSQPVRQALAVRPASRQTTVARPVVPAVHEEGAEGWRAVAH